MHRLFWLPAIALAACGTENDQRPRTVEYVTEAILAPNCGNAQCHSSFRNAYGYAFDTVEEAQRSLANGLVGTIRGNERGELIGESSSAFLITVLTRTKDRMPYDQPLPEADINMIRRWIDYGAPGAQCDPSVGRVCIGMKVYECRDTFDFVAAEDCAMAGKTCSAGACQ